MTKISNLADHTGDMIAIPVWDLPVRVVHWLLVLVVISSWISGEMRWISWHKLFGIAALSLILFRCYWGLCGSSTAQFSDFLYGPDKLRRYFRVLRSRQETYVYLGHNPLGGWNVIALLCLLLVQVTLGLFAVDVDGRESGPLARFVSFGVGRQVAHAHRTVFNVLLVFIILHVIAVGVHLFWRREDLVTPMLTGNKHIPKDSSGEALIPTIAPLYRAMLGLGTSILIGIGLALL